MEKKVSEYIPTMLLGSAEYITRYRATIRSQLLTAKGRGSLLPPSGYEQSCTAWSIVLAQFVELKFKELGSMDISSESLIVIIGVGIVAGWLAGQVMRGTGFGILGDLIVGIVGAFVGSWLLPQLHVHLGNGILSAIINATIGAVLVLFVLGLLRRRPAWR
jgi:uncharacterized membrane protein YeaQ/YmgE (transglycosylase-associated protein family)